MSTLPDTFDAVIVGSGFGGALTAWSLVRAGWRVAVLERGGWARRDADDWNARAVLVEQRYQSRSPLLVRQYGARKYAPTLCNELVGGQSVLYGGASLRLRPADLGHWPFSYAELEPYYGQAERLLGVHGEAGADPGEPPRTGPYPAAAIELSGPSQRLCRAARRAGLRPFRLPLAVNFTDEARPRCIRCNSCDGFPCRLGAKNDVATTVLEPLCRQGLELMSGTIVARLLLEHGRVRGVECIDAATQQRRLVYGRVVFLAAGALHSPAILLRSPCDGLAQRDLLGRFLMRHCNAVEAGIFPFRTNPGRVFHKQICLTDLYEQVRDEWGTAVGVIQEMYTPAREMLWEAAPWALRVPAVIGQGLVHNLMCIAEDEPQYRNRVGLGTPLDPYGLPLTTVDHDYAPRDLARRDQLRRVARRVLRRAGAVLFHTYRVDTFSHALGTLRLGTDPTDSVVDPDCRVHGVDNLYVTDASVFPASAGVNPSLTIAANALRVAARVTAAHGPASG